MTVIDQGLDFYYRKKLKQKAAAADGSAEEAASVEMVSQNPLNNAAK